MARQLYFGNCIGFHEKLIVDAPGIECFAQGGGGCDGPGPGSHLAHEFTDGSCAFGSWLMNGTGAWWSTPADLALLGGRPRLGLALLHHSSLETAPCDGVAWPKVACECMACETELPWLSVSCCESVPCESVP